MTLFFSLQDQTAKGERINKETGELSASGELSVSVELKELKEEGSCMNPQLSQVLREQLQELGINTYSSHDHRTDRVLLGQREEHLVKVLPLYIQVWTTRMRMCACLCVIVHPFIRVIFCSSSINEGCYLFSFLNEVGVFRL